jgi:hypothetical protein
LLLQLESVEGATAYGFLDVRGELLARVLVQQDEQAGIVELEHLRSQSGAESGCEAEFAVDAEFH